MLGRQYKWKFWEKYLWERSWLLVSLKNSVPNNLDPVKNWNLIFDDILKSSSVDKNQSSEINFDKILKKLNKKFVMLWGLC